MSEREPAALVAIGTADLSVLLNIAVRARSGGLIGPNDARAHLAIERGERALEAQRVRSGDAHA